MYRVRVCKSLRVCLCCCCLLSYPFPISKSAMLAPGTGHQWPHHLAALSWLCELLIYENEFFFQEEEAADMQVPT